MKKKRKRNPKIENIIFITGLGGSGSRVLGRLCKDLGFDLGSRLNESLDNLVFFKQSNYYAGIHPHNDDHYLKFKKKFLTQLEESYSAETVVIKEPNFHIFLPFLLRLTQEMHFRVRFIHIVRNVLYMMNSKNQNQFVHWRHLFPINAKNKMFQRLEFWYYANTRAIELLSSAKVDHLIVSYESLIKKDGETLTAILKFLDKEELLDQFENFVLEISGFKSRSQPVSIEVIPEKYRHMVRDF